MSSTSAGKKDDFKPSVAISIDDGVDLEAYAMALAKVIQEVRGENQDLEKRLRERTKEFREVQEKLQNLEAQIETSKDEQEKTKAELKKLKEWLFWVT